jgi:hypothetical protein
LDEQLFMAHEFFLRCFASILVAIISTYLHCPHTRLLMLVSEKKIHFSFLKDPLGIMSCWHLIEFFNVF